MDGGINALLGRLLLLPCTGVDGTPSDDDAPGGGDGDGGNDVVDRTRVNDGGDVLGGATDGGGMDGASTINDDGNRDGSKPACLNSCTNRPRLSAHNTSENKLNKICHDNDGLYDVDLQYLSFAIGIFE